MPEKTLKEKASDLEVELARVYDELRSRYSYDAARVVSQARLFIHERTKALTALEERVNAFNKPVIKEALEGYLEFLGNLPDADERPQLPRALYLLKKALEYFKEAPDGK